MELVTPPKKILSIFWPNAQIVSENGTELGLKLIDT
jgi:hypothetical protein